MKRNIKIILAVCFSIVSIISCSSSKQTTSRQIISKTEIENIGIYKNGYNSLNNNAKIALTTKYRSVVDKNIIPPSGDKHDYLSRATYYWKNPNTHDGLPWIYKDGEYNKQSFLETDHKYYYDAMQAIRDLSLAYNFSQNNVYAKRAVEIIKQWFINDSTKMNPNLNFAQGIPGKYTGTKSGIIDSRAILWVIQGIKYIKPSNEFLTSDESKFKDWCNSFLNWLLTSQFGAEEGNSDNNHGTFYDLQVASFADYVGKSEIASTTLDKVKTKRIEKQILPNGSQPFELERAHSFMYSIFNLSALIELAELADKYDIDLWNYRTNKCGSIKNAVDFIVENTNSSEKIFKDNVDVPSLFRVIPKANAKFNGEYNNVINSLIDKNENIELTSIYFVN